MNIKVDTHSHTLVSGHAYSTMHEMARAGKEHGLEALAITEHAPEMPGSCNAFYFENLKVVPREMDGIQILHGVELNIMDEQGTVDLPARLLKNLEPVIASVHMPCYHGENTMESITEAYVSVMRNPYVDIIGHPDDGRFPIDYERLVQAAKETGTLLEVNNTSLGGTAFRENAQENVCKMLNLCKKYGVMITTGSDAHVDVDAGNSLHAQKMLKECDFPEELIATVSVEKLRSCLKPRD